MDCFTIGRDTAVLESYPEVECFGLPNIIVVSPGTIYTRARADMTISVADRLRNYGSHFHDSCPFGDPSTI